MSEQIVKFFMGIGIITLVYMIWFKKYGVNRSIVGYVIAFSHAVIISIFGMFIYVGGQFLKIIMSTSDYFGLIFLIAFLLVVYKMLKDFFYEDFNIDIALFKGKEISNVSKVNKKIIYIAYGAIVLIIVAIILFFPFFIEKGNIDREEVLSIIFTLIMFLMSISLVAERIVNDYMEMEIPKEKFAIIPLGIYLIFLIYIIISNIM